MIYVKLHTSNILYQFRKNGQKMKICTKPMDNKNKS